MIGKNFLLMGLALTTSFSSAIAASGKTADGCSYQIINGQYLTTCGKNKATSGSDQVASAAAAPQQVEQQIPTSYDSVPMRYEPSAPHPSVTQTSIQPETMNVQIATPKNKLIGKEEREELADRDDTLNDNWERSHSRQHQELLDSTYVGAFLGATTMNAVTAGSALGVGVNVGTNIDDNFGFELGYTYSSQDMFLHLDTRTSPDPLAPGVSRQTDATLRNHLFTSEFQGHFTDSFKRFRPYLGAGLAWKASQLEESTVANAYGSTSVSGGSLSQNTIGGIASAGVKFRVSKNFNFGAAFKYFMPLLHQAPRLEGVQAAYNPNGPYQAAADTHLTTADDALTGAGQYQFLGGLQYLF